MAARSETDPDSEARAGQVPYDPEAWAERLAEARQRRAAKLEARMREARKPGGAEVSDSVPDGAPAARPAVPDPVTPAAAAPDNGAPALRAQKTPRVPPSPGAFARPQAQSEPSARRGAEDRTGAGRGLWLAVTVGAFCFGLGISLPIALIRAPAPQTVPPPETGPAPAPQMAAERAMPPAIAAAPDRFPAAAAPRTDGALPVPAPLPVLRRAQEPLEPAPLAVANAPLDRGILVGQPAPAPAEGLAEGLAATVRVHLPGGTPRARFAKIAGVLQSEGFDDVRDAPSPYTISETQVRYFHPEDAAAAGIVARQTGAALRDFTAYRPSPAIGSIEVWLAGQAASVQAARGSSPAFSLSREVDSFRGAVSDLFESFPSGNAR